MNEQEIELLKQLCTAFAPTSCEDEVAQIVKEHLKRCCDDVTENFPGNVIAHVKGKSNERLMVAAHMDEVGFMISKISDDGFLYFGNLGGIDPKVMAGKRVTVKTENGKYNGVISSKSIHLKSAEERKKATAADKMYIDIGADSKEDAEKYVSVGDYATFDSDFVLFGDGFIKSKSLDDRAGCYVMLKTIDYIKENGIVPYYDLYFAFTCREECGMSGAVTAANMIKPDYSLVLECTAVADVYGVDKSKQAARLGDGAVISAMDNGTVYLREMVDFAMKTGEKNGVKCQIKKLVAGGTDAHHIHLSNGGVKCINMSVPSRYIHSPSCVIKEQDLESVTEMAKLIVCGRIK